MRYEFEQKLKKIIAECGEGIDSNVIDSKTDLIRDFGFSSINIIQLIVALESEFDIEIDDEYLVFEKLSPYIELVTILRKKLGI